MSLKLIRTHFPYCIQKTESGKYVVLNRYYKPIGMTCTGADGYVDYETHAIQLGMTPKRAAQLSWKGVDLTDSIYLYQSSHSVIEASEWTAYCERLKFLAKLTTKTRGTPVNPPEN